MLGRSDRKGNSCQKEYEKVFEIGVLPVYVYEYSGKMCLNFVQSVK